MMESAEEANRNQPRDPQDTQSKPPERVLRGSSQEQAAEPC